MKKKQYDDDDGRVIADMSDVHITPFGFGYMPRRKRLTPPQKTIIKETPEYQVPETLSKKETRAMMFRAMLMALGVAMIFIVGAALFILFCIHIWFR